MGLPLNPAVGGLGVDMILDHQGHARSRVSIVGDRSEVANLDELLGVDNWRRSEDGAGSQNQRSNREFHCCVR